MASEHLGHWGKIWKGKERQGQILGVGQWGELSPCVDWARGGRGWWGPPARVHTFLVLHRRSMIGGRDPL